MTITLENALKCVGIGITLIPVNGIPELTLWSISKAISPQRLFVLDTRKPNWLNQPLRVYLVKLKVLAKQYHMV